MIAGAGAGRSRSIDKHITVCCGGRCIGKRLSRAVANLNKLWGVLNMNVYIECINSFSSKETPCYDDTV